MPSSSVRTFTDPGEYAASLVINSSVNLTVTERGKFAAKLTEINLHHSFLRRCWDALGRVNCSDWADRRVGIAVLWAPV